MHLSQKKMLPQQKMIEGYVDKKRREFEDRFGKGDKYQIALIVKAYDFLLERVLRAYEEINPEMIRKVDLLEALLVSFIIHANDLESLDTMENLVFEFKDRQ